MKKIAFIFSLLCFFSLGFAQNQDYFPVGMKNTGNDREVKSDFDGIIVKNPAKLPKQINNAAVIKVSQTHYYEGKEQTSEFEAIYFDINLTAKKGKEIKSGDVLGTGTDNVISIISRSKTIDPYLVSVCGYVPALIDGYYYFWPGMLSNQTMKYLIYSPIDVDKVRWMYNHTTDPDSKEADEDWTPGASFFYWKLLIETTLKNYPQLLKTEQSFGGVKIESATEIEYAGMKFSLGFQSGFRDYLLEEYKPGEKIYLYVDIDSISSFSKTFNCYVRDFSLVSPTAIVDDRITAINNMMNQ